MTFTFEHQLHSLIWFHPQEHHSGRELLQCLEQDSFARTHIAPPEGISRSAFFEAMNSRGVKQLLEMYHILFDLSAEDIALACKLRRDIERSQHRRRCAVQDRGPAS